MPFVSRVVQCCLHQQYCKGIVEFAFAGVTQLGSLIVTKWDLGLLLRVNRSGEYNGIPTGRRSKVQAKFQGGREVKRTGYEGC